MSQTPFVLPAAPPGTNPAPDGFDPDDDDRLIGRLLSRRERDSPHWRARRGRVPGRLHDRSRDPDRLRHCHGHRRAGDGRAGNGRNADLGSTAAAGATTQATTAAQATAVPSCVVTPEVTEGPYFVDEKLNRSDIRTDNATGTARRRRRARADAS